MASKAPIIALIDDDKIFQFTAYKTIASTAITDNILQFEHAADALKFIHEHLAYPQHLPDYIFLDINMPQIDGWMFLEDYANLKNAIPKPVSIYMVSSSIDPADIQRAKTNTHVKDYVMKPVTREKFIELLVQS